LWRKLLSFGTGALVKATIVNGEILVENGEHTGAFSGRALGNGKNGQASALG
jgi:N-acyl-D-aspartate/D-glutamate deacylase